MATWYDLPAEVKQIILEYLVAALKIKFTPRHSATRSTRAAEKDKEKEHEYTTMDSVTSLLLVSKVFLPYCELEPVLLTAAIVNAENVRGLTRIEKRFTKDALANIRQLNVDIDFTSDRWRPKYAKVLPTNAVLQSRMRDLKVLMLSIIVRYHDWNSQCFVTFEQASALATGAHFKGRLSDCGPYHLYLKSVHDHEDIDKSLREYLNGLLEHFLNCQPWRLSKYIDALLRANDGNDTLERVLSWKLHLRSSHKDEILDTKHWCLELAHEDNIILLPQRIKPGHYEYMASTWLARKINGVKLDEYYTV